MKDGRVNKCKDCNKKDVKANYRSNIDHYREYEKSRANLPHRIEGRKKYAESENGRLSGNKAKKAWASRNPIKYGASVIVGNAVRDGSLVKPESCEACDEVKDRIHGHHDDYAYPLVVRWLCSPCHNQWHRDNGPGLNG